MKKIVLLSAATVFGLACATLGVARADPTLRLTQTETVSVKPDRLSASLRAQAFAPTAAAAQEQVNAAVGKALTTLRQVNGLTPGTGSYSVWRVDPAPDAKPPVTGGWRAAQSVTVYGSEGKDVLAAIGTLQGQGMAVERLEWELAPQTAKAAEQEAALKAVRALRGRADALADAIDMRFDHFDELVVGEVARPMPLRRMVASAAPMAAPPPPQAETSEIVVSATVQAEIKLRPR